MILNVSFWFLQQKLSGFFCSWQLVIIGFVDGTLFDFTKYPINHKSYFSFDYCDTEKKIYQINHCHLLFRSNFDSFSINLLFDFRLYFFFLNWIVPIGQLQSNIFSWTYLVFQLNIFGVPAVLFSLIQCIFPATFQFSFHLIIFASIKFKSLDHINDILIIYFIFPQ